MHKFGEFFDNGDFEGHIIAHTKDYIIYYSAGCGEQIWELRGCSGMYYQAYPREWTAEDEESWLNHVEEEFSSKRIVWRKGYNSSALVEVADAYLASYTSPFDNPKQKQPHTGIPSCITKEP
jgi:hypothetical protein